MKREQLVKMIREIRNLAGEASLTGMFRKGAPMLVKHFNACLKTAREQNFMTGQMPFSELGQEAGMDEIGISAGLLAAYLDDRKTDDEGMVI